MNYMIKLLIHFMYILIRVLIKQKIITTEIEPGSTSTGSMNPEDIIDGIRFLSTDDDLCDLIVEFDDATYVEDKNWAFDGICDRLNEICPDDLIFSANENDDTDYGFWSIY